MILQRDGGGGDGAVGGEVARGYGGPTGPDPCRGTDATLDAGFVHRAVEVLIARGAGRAGQEGAASNPIGHLKRGIDGVVNCLVEAIDVNVHGAVDAVHRASQEMPLAEGDGMGGGAGRDVAAHAVGAVKINDAVVGLVAVDVKIEAGHVPAAGFVGPDGLLAVGVGREVDPGGKGEGFSSIDKAGVEEF